MRLRLAPALGQSSTSTARLNASHGPWNSQTNSAIISQPIICIRWMYRPGTGKAAKGRKHHPVAADEQQQDRHPHPGKEFLEGDPHQLQALRRLERTERRAQADIDREHAADPDNGAEYVQGEGDGGHERGPGSRNESLRAGLCEAWASGGSVKIPRGDADVGCRESVGAGFEPASGIRSRFAATTGCSDLLRST